MSWASTKTLNHPHSHRGLETPISLPRTRHSMNFFFFPPRRRFFPDASLNSFLRGGDDQKGRRVIQLSLALWWASRQSLGGATRSTTRQVAGPPTTEAARVADVRLHRLLALSLSLAVYLAVFLCYSFSCSFLVWWKRMAKLSRLNWHQSVLRWRK